MHASVTVGGTGPRAQARGRRLWFGIPVSALAHAAVIAAVAGLPWLWAPPRPPVPAVVVSLVTPADLEALARRVPAPPPPEAAAPPAAAPKPTPKPAPLPRWLEPEPETLPEEVPDLAPQFDAASPLGFERALPPPESLSSPDEEALETDAATGQDAWLDFYRTGVDAAVRRAQIYPRAALDRGVTGTVRLRVRVDRSGRLLAAEVVQPSGSVLLDRAGIEAASRARLPMAPSDLFGAAFDVDIRLVFAPGG